jgi:peptidase E
LPARPPQIVALGGGGFSERKDGSQLDDYMLTLTGTARPRVCFLPTASGDADHYVVRFYRRFSATCDASHVSLFRRDQGTGGVEDALATHLLSQDLIYVGGGNVVSMLGAWRAHGLDSVLRRAWRRGIVLCGPSAGSLCWFEQALSAFHGAPRAIRGLGLLPYSNCVHYDAEPERRDQYHRLVAEGMIDGFAVEDGVALHFEGTRMVRAVSDRPAGRAFRVELEPDSGRVRERGLKVRCLDTSSVEPPEPEAPRRSRRSARARDADADAPARTDVVRPIRTGGGRAGMRFAV